MLSTTLRRALVASGLVVATGFMAFSAVYADDVVIGGTVASTLALNSSLPKTDINLDPSQTNTEVKVAKVLMGTNNSTGLKVVPTGTFTLAKAAPDAAITPVTFTVGMVAGDGSGTPTVTYVSSGADMFSTSAAAATTTEHSLYIKYSTAAFQDPGAYAATITLTASDN